MLEPKARIYLPESIPDDVVRSAKNHAAENFGGFTVLHAQGGWNDQDGETITEQTEILEITGMNDVKAQSTADWVAKRSDEEAVMWECWEVEMGLES